MPPDGRDPNELNEFVKNRAKSGNGPPPKDEGDEDEGGKQVECPECGAKFKA